MSKVLFSYQSFQNPGELQNNPDLILVPGLLPVSRRRQWPKLRLVAVGISALFCVLVDVIVAYCVICSLLVHPDRGDYAALEILDVYSGFGAVLAWLSIFLRTVPVALQWLNKWWFLPPIVLFIVAIARQWWFSANFGATSF